MHSWNFLDSLDIKNSDRSCEQPYGCQISTQMHLHYWLITLTWPDQWSSEMHWKQGTECRYHNCIMRSQYYDAEAGSSRWLSISPRVDCPLLAKVHVQVIHFLIGSKLDHTIDFSYMHLRMVNLWHRMSTEIWRPMTSGSMSNDDVCDSVQAWLLLSLQKGGMRNGVKS